MDLHPYLFCLSFYLLCFVLPPFKDNGLPFWVPDVLCQHLEVVLWNLLSIQMFFQWICGGETDLPILFLCQVESCHIYLIILSVYLSNRISFQGLISLFLQRLFFTLKLNLVFWACLLVMFSGRRILLLQSILGQDTRSTFEDGDGMGCITGWGQLARTSGLVSYPNEVAEWNLWLREFSGQDWVLYSVVGGTMN